MKLYLDTSAAMKLLVQEAESAALADALYAHAGSSRLLGSWLLHAELQCAAVRHPSVIRPGSVTAVLDRLVLVDLDRTDLLDAPVRGACLRSQDALHLAVALRVGADALLTYDAEQARAALAAGIQVLQPA
ncbi:PIN domain-containing protein [uncultured Amnibacterium sp.]|uniref:PIN domain-containing protein n=1 Tax=uncultured Amnibacterium sp. TaxID=1631851 RepID=UPI0035C94BEF